ncbi:DUF3861 family protein [Rhodoplanes roseus]|uniref:DUF3861 domain-containing protein n=1 Tax=Rhodoplanes roseus TaxID=29409 RepID=A0A327KYP4_9BRAD|nr:DUF3861 family protein [Rhodoplanes roseus]RAI43154.1 hypothetical protein CH341_15770 [Rhodoplanes roseus]
MKHRYAVRIADTSARADGSATPEDIAFEVESHDDLNAIVAKMTERKIFDEAETKAFCVGLKLLGGVLLQHRADPLFADFAPAFGAFMKTLKRPAAS